MLSLNPLNWFKGSPTDGQPAKGSAPAPAAPAASSGGGGFFSRLFGGGKPTAEEMRDVNLAIRNIPQLNATVQQITSIMNNAKSSEADKKRATAAMDQINTEVLDLVRQSHKLGDKEPSEPGFITRTFRALTKSVKSALPTAGMVALATFGVKSIGDAAGAGKWVGTRMSDKDKASRIEADWVKAQVSFAESKDAAIKDKKGDDKNAAVAAILKKDEFKAELAALRDATKKKSEEDIAKSEGSLVDSSVRPAISFGVVALVINTLVGAFTGAPKQQVDQEHQALVAVHNVLRNKGRMAPKGGAKGAAPQGDDVFIGPGSVGMGGPAQQPAR